MREFPHFLHKNPKGTTMRPLMFWVRIMLAASLLATMLIMFARNAKAEESHIVNQECHAEHNDLRAANRCVRELAKEVEAAGDALTRAWEYSQNPATLVSAIPTNDLTWIATGEDFAFRIYNLVASMNAAINPSGSRKVQGIVTGIFSNPAMYPTLLPTLRHAAVELLKRSGASGSVQTFLERVKPVLEKPIDPVLAQQAMHWRYKEGCQNHGTSTEDTARCEQLPFYAAFKAYYGAEPTIMSIWMLGSLNRRSVFNHKGLAPAAQKELLIALDELGK